MDRFLTAEWRYLAMLNYEIDPDILKPYIPLGTELDLWNGRTYVSLVGFLFLDTKVLNVPIPFHRNFEEVNLRFYLRRRDRDGWRRAVGFIKEIVPRWAIATVARMVYNEKYVSLPMCHSIDLDSDGRLKLDGTVKYEWQFDNRWHSLWVKTSGEPVDIPEGSEAEFIAEHYWGYSAQPSSTIEYRVEHPRWQIRDVIAYGVDCNVETLYGKEFVQALSAEPTSAFLAEGSSVTVYQGIEIPIE